MRWSASHAIDYGDDGKLLIDTEENRYLVESVAKLPPADRAVQAVHLLVTPQYGFDFQKQKGNAAFDSIQQGDYWQWIEPQQLIDTNWADPDADGKDNLPDSMLDFVFARRCLAGLALGQETCWLTCRDCLKSAVPSRATVGFWASAGISAF